MQRSLEDSFKLHHDHVPIDQAPRPPAQGYWQLLSEQHSEDACRRAAAKDGDPPVRLPSQSPGEKPRLSQCLILTLLVFLFLSSSALFISMDGAAPAN